MAKIYSLPDGFTEPVLDFTNIKAYDTEVEKLFTDLKAFCVKRMVDAGVNDPYAGEIIDFPVADGKAMYMVAASKPVQLIHLPVWDKWYFQYDSKITKADIVRMVESNKKLAELFGRKKN